MKQLIGRIGELAVRIMMHMSVTGGRE